MNILIAKQLVILSVIQHFQYPHFVAINQGLSSLQGIIAVIILITVFWTVNRKIGGRLLLLYFIAGMATWLLKDYIQLARPFMYDPALGLSQATGNSFPSGDACAATVVYGGLAAYFRNKFLYVAAVIIVSLVAYSRLALGVHYPTDVIGGIVLGILLLMIQFKVIEKKLPLININKVIYFPLVIIMPVLISTLFADITPIVAAGTFSGLSLMLGLIDKKINDRLPVILNIVAVIFGIVVIYFIYRGLFSRNTVIVANKNTLGYFSSFMAGCWIGWYAYFIGKLARVSTFCHF